MAQSIHDRIEKRAYELFCARGGTHGYAIEDWLAAEKEIAQPAGKKPRGKKSSGKKHS